MPKRGEIDYLWEAMAYVMGYRPATRSERGRWNKALQELREIDASPEDVVLRARAYVVKWPTIELTPNALVGHWGELGSSSSPVTRWSSLPDYTGGRPALPEGTVDHEATERAKAAFMNKLKELSPGAAPE